MKRIYDDGQVAQLDAISRKAYELQIARELEVQALADLKRMYRKAIASGINYRDIAPASGMSMHFGYSILKQMQKEGLSAEAA